MITFAPRVLESTLASWHLFCVRGLCLFPQELIDFRKLRKRPQAIIRFDTLTDDRGAEIMRIIRIGTLVC